LPFSSPPVLLTTSVTQLSETATLELQDQEEGSGCYQVERVFGMKGDEVFVLWTHFQEPTWEKVSSVKHLQVFKKWKKKWNGKQVVEGAEDESLGDWDAEEEEEEEEEEKEEEEEEEEGKKEGERGKRVKKREKKEEEKKEEEEQQQQQQGRKRKGSQSWVSYDVLKRRKVNPGM